MDCGHKLELMSSNKTIHCQSAFQGKYISVYPKYVSLGQWLGETGDHLEMTNIGVSSHLVILKLYV